MPVAGKDRCFHIERRHLLQADAERIAQEYAPLISFLETVCTR